jgi:uncharacterized protein (TIGR03000 family)
MGEQRHLFRTGALVAALALLAPAAARAQFIVGVPFGTARPIMLPSAYYPAGYYSGGMAGYSPFGYGGYGYGFGGAGYGMMGYPYAAGYPFASVPMYQPMTFQPLMSSTGAIATSGLPAATGSYYSGTASYYPRMRDKFYPLGTYGTTAQAGLSSYGPAAVSSSAPLGSYAPVAYASTVCGALTYAPVATASATYAAATVAALSPPTRLRQANYPPDPGIRPASYTGGAASRRAEVFVRLPSPNATVWFDGVRMKQTGKTRRFFTPRLDPDGRFTYHVRVSWTENGKTRQQERDIYVRAGDVLEVNFTQPTPRSAGGAS